MGIFTDTQRGTAVSRLWKLIPLLIIGCACLFTPVRAADVPFTDTCVVAQQAPAGTPPPAGERCAEEESRKADFCVRAQPLQDVQEPCVYAEVMPSFKGGTLPEFQRWVCQRIEYPADAFRRKAEGRVVCAFVVETDGTVSSVQAVRAPDALLAAEVERVVSLSPRWTAGQQDGVPVRVRLMLPVDFRVQGQERRSIVQDSRKGVSDPLDETLPRFGEAGLGAFRQEMLSQIHYPKKALETFAHGRVVCSFVVETDGSVSIVEVLRSSDPSLSQEAVRVVSASRQWTPGMKDGKCGCGIFYRLIFR